MDGQTKRGSGVRQFFEPGVRPDEYGVLSRFVERSAGVCAIHVHAGVFTKKLQCREERFRIVRRIPRRRIGRGRISSFVLLRRRLFRARNRGIFGDGHDGAALSTHRANRASSSIQGDSTSTLKQRMRREVSPATFCRTRQAQKIL